MRCDGIPVKRELIVTQGGGRSVHIRPQIGVDAQQIQENFQKLARYKLVAEDKSVTALGVFCSPDSRSPDPTPPTTMAAPVNDISLKTRTEEMQIDTIDPNLIIDVHATKGLRLCLW